MPYPQAGRDINIATGGGGGSDWHKSGRGGRHKGVRPGRFLVWCLAVLAGLVGLGRDAARRVDMGDGEPVTRAEHREFVKEAVRRGWASDDGAGGVRWNRDVSEDDVRDALR